MPTIYISDSGDDKNDGLSLQTPIYSLKRAKELQGGRNDCSWHFGPRAWKRIKKELSEKGKRPMLPTLLWAGYADKAAVLAKCKLKAMELYTREELSQDVRRASEYVVTCMIAAGYRIVLANS